MREPRGQLRQACVLSLHPATCLPAQGDTAHTADRGMLPTASGAPPCPRYDAGDPLRQPQGPMPPKLLLLPPLVTQMR